MAEDSDLERTEPASGRRLSQAREEGNVPHSRELGSFLALFVGVSTLWVMGPWMYQRMAAILHQGLSINRQQVFDPLSMAPRVSHLFGEGLLAIMPVLILLLITAVLGTVVISGFNLSSKTLAFQASRLSLLSGIKRVISVDGLVEMLKAVAKAALVGGIGAWVVYARQGDALALVSMALEPSLASFMHLVFAASIAMVSGLALLALIDVPFQLWRYHSRLRMTKEELRQEAKEQEGDPQVKGRIRQRQREMARRRMMQEVPTADVVVTNPTHYAVALRYVGGSMRAPRVVAKGADLVAEQIRELARAHQVPLLEAPPLARALFRHAELDAEVPAALYAAVAEVLAWVYSLRQAHAMGRAAPPEPSAVFVPPAMDPASAQAARPT